jgi:hypothetical protein
LHTLFISRPNAVVKAEDAAVTTAHNSHTEDPESSHPQLSALAPIAEKIGISAAEPTLTFN